MTKEGKFSKIKILSSEVPLEEKAVHHTHTWTLAHIH